MQKQIIVIGMTLILLSVGLSGCTEINEEDGTAKPKDTDGDGYSDNEDDFPTDPTLHLNESFSSSPTADIRVGVNVPPEGGDRNAIGVSYTIESEWKYVEWKWSVQPDNVSIREWFIFQIKNPSGYTEYTGNELSSMQYHREPIDYNNSGNWTFIFRYVGGESPAPQYLPEYVTVTFEIYKVR